ncbi:hypothetical protein BHM03_00058166 [Ensete ventricosum]|nr:hypothetical protein BHM03_00058166 [Ensete ventricosum]
MVADAGGDNGEGEGGGKAAPPYSSFLFWGLQRNLPGVYRKLAKMTQGRSPEEDRETRRKIVGVAEKLA